MCLLLIRIISKGEIHFISKHVTGLTGDLNTATECSTMVIPTCFNTCPIRGYVTELGSYCWHLLWCREITWCVCLGCRDTFTTTDRPPHQPRDRNRKISVSYCSATVWSSEGVIWQRSLAILPSRSSAGRHHVTPSRGWLPCRVKAARHVESEWVCECCRNVRNKWLYHWRIFLKLHATCVYWKVSSRQS